MFITALVTIAKMWKSLKCLSTEGWINKMWYMHTKEYYLNIKRNDILMASYNIDENTV